MGVRPSSLAARSLATSMAQAPSLRPEELPAVTVPSFWKAGASAASFSCVVSGRGCSSRESMIAAPVFLSTPTWMGAISSARRPDSMAAPARLCDRTASSSCSWRVTPQRSATFSAVMPRASVPCIASMRGLIMRHPRVVSNRVWLPRAGMLSGLGMTHGARVICSTPPAMTRSASPLCTRRAASVNACMPDPHSRLTVTPGTETGMPASRRPMRATLRLSSPAWLAQPAMTSSMRSAGTPVRSSSAAMTWPSRSSARTEASAPPWRPNGVRTPSIR